MTGFDLNNFLSVACSKGASDIHLKLGKSPTLRILNSIVKTTLPPLTDDDIDNILATVLPAKHLSQINDKFDFDFTYEVPSLSRFRVNYCLDLGAPKITFRVIPYEIPTLEELNLPPALKEFTQFTNGIVLITGPTGTGKSTTIASLLDIINAEYAKHIVTVEDPVEFVYTDKKSLITQRQIGIDVNSFPDGVKYALRQDPDVLLIGEIRDRETVEAALSAAETGHLVFSTVHTNSAVQTINRIINMFDDNIREFMRNRLANSLRATVAQKLIEKADEGRVPALEIMTVTPTVKDYIIKNQLEKIYPLMQDGGLSNMTTLNASVYALLKAGIITEESALMASDNQTELTQMIRGYYHGVKHKYQNNSSIVDFGE